MIYLSLFLNFIKIGLFSFGGAYGAIPLIQETVIHNNWLSEEMFSNMLAISESTPGPIMVNAATFIGYDQAGELGALVATLGVVTPSFIIIMLVASILQKYIQNNKVQNVLKGVKPCIVGLVLATGIYMIVSMFKTTDDYSVQTIIIFTVLVAILMCYNIIRKKELSPIILIIISAVLGIIFF